MTASTLQLRDSMVIGILQSADEALITKLYKSYVRIQANLKNATSQKEKEEFISKEEILAGIDAGLKDVKEGRVMSMDEFYKELEAV